MWLCRNSYQEDKSVFHPLSLGWAFWLALVNRMQQKQWCTSCSRGLATPTLPQNPVQLSHEQTGACLLEAERPHEAKPSHPSWGHPRSAYSPDLQSCLPNPRLTRDNSVSPAKTRRTIQQMVVKVHFGLLKFTLTFMSLSLFKRRPFEYSFSHGQVLWMYCSFSVGTAALKPLLCPGPWGFLLPSLLPLFHKVHPAVISWKLCMGRLYFSEHVLFLSQLVTIWAAYRLLD